jgi:hypothetical protein
LLDLAEKISLIPTGGSDYHGAGKVDHDLGVNRTPMASWDSICARVLERGGIAFAD